MASGDRNRHIKISVVDIDRAGGSLQSQRLNVFSIHAHTGIHSIEDRGSSVYLINAAELIIFSVQNDRAIFKIHILKALCLCFEHAVTVLQEFEVAGAYIRNDHRVRSRSSCQIRHLTEMADAHLENRNLMLLRDSEDCKRQAEIVIKIAGSLKNIVFLRQNCRNHLFRRSLADGTGDSDHRDSELHSVKLGDSLNRYIRSLDFDIRVTFRSLVLLCQSKQRSALHDLRNKIMSVELSPLHRDIQTSLCDLAAVRCDSSHLASQYVFTVYHRSAAGFRDVFRCQILHYCNTCSFITVNYPAIE